MKNPLFLVKTIHEVLYSTLMLFSKNQGKH